LPGVEAAMDKPKKHEDVLMAAIGFDEDDLEPNRAGRLSDRQTAKLKRERGNDSFSFVAWLVAALVLMLIAALTTSTIVDLVSGAVALVMGFTALKHGIATVQTQRSLRRGTVDAAEGRIRLDMKTRRQSNPTFYLYTEDRRFTVRKLLFLTLKSGDPYRIYYLPTSKRIISAEWLRDDSPFVDAPSVRRERSLDLELEATEAPDDNALFGDDGELRSDARR
jgi:hypothetical protein